MCLWWLADSGWVRGSARGPRAAGGRAEGLVASNVVGRSILDDKTMRLLKALREQLGETSASRTVDAAAAAERRGRERGGRVVRGVRERLGESAASRTVAAAAAANSLGMDRGTLDFHRSLHDLVRADYLEEPPNHALRAQGKNLTTSEGQAGGAHRS